MLSFISSTHIIIFQSIMPTIHKSFGYESLTFTSSYISLLLLQVKVFLLYSPLVFYTNIKVRMWCSKSSGLMALSFECSLNDLVDKPVKLKNWHDVPWPTFQKSPPHLLNTSCNNINTIILVDEPFNTQYIRKKL